MDLSQYAGQQVLQCAYNLTAAKAFDALVDSQGLDVWGRSAHGTVDIRVPSLEAAHVVSEQMDCTVVIDSVEQHMRETERVRREKGGEGWFEQYQQYPDIVDWYKQLAVDNEDIISFDIIGQSFEGRDMPVIRISETSEPKPAVYLQCQIHAREWISGAVCMYITEKLLEDYRRGDPEVTRVLRDSEIHVVPFANPDGYEFTYASGGDRLWRKSRNPNAGSSCIGTDLNRNYNDNWGEGGSSMDPCSGSFMGSAPESEPETKATSEYFRSLPGVIGAVDMHAYSQLLLRPAGWTNMPTQDEQRLFDLGEGMQRAIRSYQGFEYQNIRSIQLYLTTGSAQDWFYGVDATSTNNGFRAASYTFELRPLGANPGFELPPDQIIDNGEETYLAWKYFLNDVVTDPIRLDVE